MGFGLITIGFLALVLVDYALGGIIAGVALSYGFYMLSGHDARFRVCIFTSAVMAPCGILKLMYYAGVFGEIAHQIFEFIFHVFWGVTVIIFLWLVMKIVQESDAKSFALQAKTLMVFNAVYFIVTPLEALVSMGSAGIVLVFFKYLLIIVNTLFAHKCFSHISTESRTKRDLKQLADIDAKRAEKKRRQQERLDRIREGKK